MSDHIPNTDAPRVLAQYRYLSPVATPAEVAALRARVAELEAALRTADQFITNGIELGYIRMPSPGGGDPALLSPGIIRAALGGTDNGR